MKKSYIQQLPAACVGGCVLASAGFGDGRLVVATPTSRWLNFFDLLIKADMETYAEKLESGDVSASTSPLFI